MGPASSGIVTAFQVLRGGSSNGKNPTESEPNYLENNISLEAPVGIFLFMSNRTELAPTRESLPATESRRLSIFN